MLYKRFHYRLNRCAMTRRIPVSTNLLPETLTKLEDEARNTGKSVSAIIREAVEQHLEKLLNKEV